MNKFWFNCGWYKDDPFKLISITVWETDGPGDVVFLNIQFLHFVFAFGLFS